MMVAAPLIHIHIANTYTGLVTAGKEKFQADPFVMHWQRSAVTR
jgi:hypothetical protein